MSEQQKTYQQKDPAGFYIAAGREFAEILDYKIPAPWMAGINAAKYLAVDAPKILNSPNGVLDFTSGLKGLSTFFFKTPKWDIDGVYFDGIISTVHNSGADLTSSPVTKKGLSDPVWSSVKPDELKITVMMSDAVSGGIYQNADNLNKIYQIMQAIKNFSNYVEVNRDLNGSERSANAWTILKCMQLSGKKLTVKTRLRTYRNMVITNLIATDDISTLNALKCEVTLKEVIEGTGQSGTETGRPDTVKDKNPDGVNNALSPAAITSIFQQNLKYKY